MEILDSYARRARFFPAILALAPALALITIAMPWNLGAPQLLIGIAVAVLVFFFGDWARRLGLRAERRLFGSTGGKPFPTVLRHRDSILDSKSKTRYLAFLGQRLGERPPTAADEELNPAAADGFYVRCGNWLRERTRDKQKFKVLFEENVTYGFRRNLYGLKWFALSLNLFVVIACLVLIEETRFDSNHWLFVGVLIFATIHAIIFFTLVTKTSVIDASDQYGRQLILSCEAFLESEGGQRAS